MPWEYSFTVPMDMEGLIEKMGGNVDFERRLDYIVSWGFPPSFPQVYPQHDTHTSKVNNKTDAQQFQPNTSEQDRGPNGAGISSIMNIGFVSIPFLAWNPNRRSKPVLTFVQQ